MIGGQQCKVNYAHYVRSIMCIESAEPRARLRLLSNKSGYLYVL